MKKFLLLMLTLFMLVPAMGFAKDKKGGPTYEIKSAKASIGDFNVTYPTIVNYKDAKVATKINEQILATVMKDVMPLTQLKAHNLAKYNGAGTVNYEVTCNTYGLLSIVLTNVVKLKDDKGNVETILDKQGLNYTNTGDAFTSKDLSKIYRNLKAGDPFSIENITTKLASAQRASAIKTGNKFKGFKEKDTYNYYMDNKTNLYLILDGYEMGSETMAPQVLAL